MTVSFYKRGEFAWVQDVRANFVCIYKGELCATIFSNAWEPWQILLHPENVALLVQGEIFPDPQSAIARAEEFISGTVNGASYRTMKIGHLSTVDW